MSALGKHGSTARWRRLRELVLTRDGWRCQLNGPRCQGEAHTVDHLVARKHGGTDDLDNLVAACAPCNYAKGAGAFSPSFQSRRDTPASVSLSLPGMGSTTRVDHLKG